MPRTTAAEKVRRDAQVVGDRLAGLRWATVAERNGISERQAREIVRTHRESQPPLDGRDPVETISEVIERHEALLEQSALLYESAKQESTRLGALKLQARVLEQSIALEQACGLMPALNLISRDIETRQVGQAVVRVLVEHNVSVDVRRAIVEALKPARAWQGHTNGADG